MSNIMRESNKTISKITEDIIEEKGYQWEKYTVKTEDGYINTMYRITHRKGKKSTKLKTPVLLSHGLICSCAVFLNQSCLAYYLADQGFDVWLPNNRGTTYSRKHVTLDEEKDKESYWNFGWHEIGIYDIPAFIDYVIEKTGFQKILFIGHSQGVTSVAVLLSERPEYNHKLSLCCLLGPPVTYEYELPCKLKFYTGIITFFEMINRYFNLPFHTIPFTDLVRCFGVYIKPNSLFHNIHMRLMNHFVGFADYDQCSEIDFSKFSLTTPNDASLKQLFHYAQIVRNKKFSKYDYGAEENMKLYGAKEPPRYDLSRVTCPVALFYGKNDMFNCHEDNFQYMIGNVVKKFVVDYDLFNHLDFLTARDSIPLVYHDLSLILREYASDRLNYCNGGK